MRYESSLHPGIAASGTRANPVELLARVTLFSELTEDELARLAERCSTRSYARGEVVWTAGDKADEMLVVVNGELEVRGTGTQNGRQELLGRIRPGECVGEMALLLDERRSATVACSRRASTIVLCKEDFRVLVRDDTRLLTSLTKLLSRRAASLAQRQSAGRLVSVDDRLHGGARRRDPEEIDLRTRTRRALPPVVDLAIDTGRGDGALARSVERVVGTLGGQFGMIVVDLPSPRGDALALADTFCDRVVHVVSAPSPAPGHRPGVLQVVNSYAGRRTSSPLNHCEQFVIPVEPMLKSARKEDASSVLSDPTLPAARVLGRLARKLMGATVGVALGGGGAFGIAHVGVLAALTEAGLPVDLVAGTSMGSIVAIGYAAGLQPSTMSEIARRIGNVPTALSAIDPSFTGTGLLGGRRLVSIFAPLLPCKSFDDLEVPCRVVAMDIETGERVDIVSGRLDEAFRASCSIPVILEPVRVGGRSLVDGSMIDPVPADVAREMRADIVVADMAEFTWIDFHRAVDIIQRGYEAGARVAPVVRSAMEDRLAPLTPLTPLAPVSASSTSL